MNKRIVALVTCIVLIGLLFVTGCETIKSRTDGELTWIHFDWEKATIGDRYLEKAAMLVPVTIDNLPQKFNMQFDLGATISEFYGTTIAPFLERYPDLAKKLNTPDNQQRPRFSSINLGLGTVVLNNLTIFNRENYGDTLAIGTIDSDEEIHIGTIGPDIVQDKILISACPQSRLLCGRTLHLLPFCTKTVRKMPVLRWSVHNVSTLWTDSNYRFSRTTFRYYGTNTRGIPSITGGKF